MVTDMTTQITYDIPDDKIEAIGEMLKYTDNLSTDELLGSAMYLLEWALDNVKSGRDIVAINGNSGAYTSVNLKIIENVKKL